MKCFADCEAKYEYKVLLSEYNIISQHFIIYYWSHPTKNENAAN